MPASKAQQKATNKYIAKTYDRINLTVIKGKKETIQIHAEDQGQSVNAYINAAIDEKMERDTGGVGTPIEARGISLAPAILKAARKGAQAAGEGVPEFIARAVDNQVQRDQTSLKLGINPTNKKAPDGESET